MAVFGPGIRADLKFFLYGRGREEMEDGLSEQTCVEKHLTAANRVHISGFWGL